MSWSWTLVIGGVVIGMHLIAIALCRSAARGDAMSDEACRRFPQGEEH